MDEARRGGRYGRFVASVVQLWRYPLKSGRGESLRQARVGSGGVAGDRRWACVDVDDGTVASAKHPGRWGRLLEVEARVEEGKGAGVCWVTVAGQTVAAGTEEAEDLLCAHLGRKVRLTCTLPDRPRTHRFLPQESGLVPEWMHDADPGQELVTPLSGGIHEGRFLDFGAVHLVTTSALAGLARELGRAEVEAVVFRPNLVIDTSSDPPPGTQLRIGDVLLRIQIPTPRCVIPGVRRTGGQPSIDSPLLEVLARRHRTHLPGLGAAACFGTYAEVVHPGVIQVGQMVQVADRA